MGAKQDIVIVNEYTVKNSTKKGGSRGGTPGDYVLRYMAREDAIEQCTPVKLYTTDNYITRYMAREEATETLLTADEIRSGTKDMDGIGGVAFGYGSHSLSHEEVLEASRDIQRNFDAGKTVMKTVISFDQEYLKRMGLVDEEFEVKKKGDYRGNVDQMKLRFAIMNGLKKMSKSYDDLQYVGVIQVDTKHVHCHLAMVDRGKGTLAEDGTQKGKISERNKKILRRGIDMYLDEKQPIRMMSSDITQDRRNLRCLIKKRSYQAFNEYGTPQFLLACLPENRNMWRANSNAKAMKKPNQIVRQYVKEILKQPDSGYKELLQNIDRYAAYRREREQLSSIETKKIIQKGKERVIVDCMNSVYSSLKQIPKNELSIETPMLKIAGASIEENRSLAGNDSRYEFTYKLRSYSNRLEHHKKEMNKYRSLAETYEKTENRSKDSIALYQFFKMEEEYNEKLMSKYQHFLSFIPPEEEYEEEFKKLMEYKKKLKAMQDMCNDSSLKKMTQKNAEDYGQRVYNMHGGRYAVIAPEILERRQEQMQTSYEQKKKQFENKLSEYGMSLKNDAVHPTPKYDFATVKALDIHHLGYDFHRNIPVSEKNIERFIEQTNKRYESFQKAREYLERSGQKDTVFQLPQKDIEVMKQISTSLEKKRIVVSKISEELKETKRSKTVEIKEQYTRDLELSIQAAIQSLQMDTDYEFE